MMTAQQLRQLRIKLGISARSVAKAFHYSTSTINRLERNFDTSPAFLAQYETFLRDCENGFIRPERVSKNYILARNRINGISHYASNKQVLYLRQLRLMLGVKSGKLAAFIGFAPNTWSAKENGAQNMTIQEFEKAIDFLLEVLRHE